MALQVDVVRYTNKQRKTSNKKVPLKFAKIAAAIPVVLTITILAVTTSFIAHFDSKKNIIEKKKEEIEREIHNLTREIENTKNRIEAASGERMKRQITRLNLKLDLPKWKQRRKLDLSSLNNAAKAQTSDKKIAKSYISKQRGLQ